jgi:hypothetical protein
LSRSYSTKLPPIRNQAGGDPLLPPSIALNEGCIDSNASNFESFKKTLS